jgi:hypothetical protein
MRAPRLTRARLTPAIVISMITMFVALAGTGVAAEIVPLAKRALTADTAKMANKAKVAERAKVAATAKTAESAGSAATAQSAAAATTAGDAATLNGMTAAQIAALPGPSAGIPASSIVYRTDSFEVNSEGATSRVTANCQSGERVIGGGWSQDSGAAYVLRDSPRADGTGWNFTIWGESGNNLAAVGTVYAVCVKTS